MHIGRRIVITRNTREDATGGPDAYTRIGVKLFRNLRSRYIMIWLGPIFMGIQTGHTAALSKRQMKIVCGPVVK